MKQVYHHLLFTAIFFGLIFTSNAQEQTEEVPVISIPNRLSGKEDGTLEPLVLPHLARFQHHYLRIFNRRGRLVFSTRTYGNQWPDSNAVEDKYFYMLQLDDKRISGWIELDRHLVSRRDTQP